MAIRVKHIALSPSAIQLYLSCPQKFLYEKFQARTERALNPLEPSNAEWGTMMHEHLARHYRGEPFVPFYPSGGFTSAKFANVDTRFQEYQKCYSGETPPEILQVETTAKRELTNVISLMGTADLITSDGVWDHKTSTKLDEAKDFDKFAISDQFPHYLWLAGRTSGTVTINQICSAPSPGARTADVQKAAAMRFNRIAIDVDESRMNDWFARTKETAKEIVRTLEEGSAWLKKRTGACGDWNGCFFATRCRYGLYEPDSLVSLTNDHFSITIET